MKKKLSDENVNLLDLPKKGYKIYLDTKTKGFGVRVSATGSGVYIVEITHEGKRTRRTIGKTSELSITEARGKALAAQAVAASGIDALCKTPNEEESATVKAWVKTYMRDVERTKKQPRDDRVYLGKFVETFGEFYIRDITAKHIYIIRETELQAVVERKIGRGETVTKNSGHTTVNRFIASIRSMLAAAVRLGIIPANPALGLRPLRENVARSVVLTDDEVTAVLSAAKEENLGNRSIIIMLFETGARKSEIINVRWGDVMLDDRLIKLPSSKSGKPQVIPISDKAMTVLNELLTECSGNADHYVFHSVGGPASRRSSIRTLWNRVKDRAGVTRNVCIHDIRRTVGLHVARSSGLHVASTLLRHSSVEITAEIYAPLGVEDTLAAVNVLGW